MKVIHVITRFILGGADENTLYTCNGQVKGGHDVMLVVGKDWDAAMRERLDPAVQFVVLDSLTRDVSTQLLSHFGDKVYRTVIPRNVRLAEAPSHGLPIVRYDRSSRGSAAYQALAQEIVNKLAKSAN